MNEEMKKWSHLKRAYQEIRPQTIQPAVWTALNELTNPAFWNQLERERSDGVFDWGLSTLDNALLCIELTSPLEIEIRKELKALFPRFAGMTYESFAALEEREAMA